MKDDLRAEVLTRLVRDYGLKQKGKWLRGGKCPQCSRKELYASPEKPWVVRCGRLNHCGNEIHIKDVYDDLFDDWSKRHVATAAAPNAAADAYLRFGRGFDLKRLQGLYTQDNYYDRGINQGTATVRFALDKGGHWERLIDRPQRFGKQKARFAPGKSYQGTWWASSWVKDELPTVAKLWIVEGIFDAIALEHHRIAAVASLSCNNFPEDSLRALSQLRTGNRPVLVFAYDNDNAGRAFIRKAIRRAREMGYQCEAALIPQPANGRKIDWNDIHLRACADGLAVDADDGASDASDGTDAEEAAHADAAFQTALAAARHQGALFLAKTALEKGVLMHREGKRGEFHFGFRNRLYWYSFNHNAYKKAREELAKQHGDDDMDQHEDALVRAASTVEQMANCYPEALYFQRHEVTDESWYYFRVDFPHDAPSVKGTFTGGHVASASEFKKRIISLAQGAVFSGNQHQLDRMMEDQLFAIKTVETIDFVGYSKEHGAYVLGDLAVKDGQLVQANDEDYFEFNKLRLKTTQKSIRMDVNTDADSFDTRWLEWLWLCFGSHGMVALAFWFGSLFAEQVRAAHKSFPFLEATGEAGAGKTTLLTFLWKLLGRSDYEGFDPSKSSRAGRARAMGQVSNMPVVLLEADRTDPDKAHTKTFEWDELKDFYGGGTLATRGVRNGGNDTYEPPFRGTIVITQNAAVVASQAILTRIVKLHFKLPAVTPESRIAADNLNAMQVEQLSNFLIRATKLEAAVLERFAERVKFFEAALRERKEIRMERVLKNHAQMLALVDCLRMVLPLTDDMVRGTREALVDMALERQQAIVADSPAVVEFWEVYEYLEAMSETPVVNHSKAPDRIAINLNEFAAKAAQHSQKLADLGQLRELLKNSRRHKFIDSNVVVASAIRTRDSGTWNGTPRPANIKCWVFQKSN